MDIVLNNAEGLPENAYVSIRVGDTRRQTPWRAQQRLHFPTGSSRSVHFDVFQRIGSTQLSLAGISAREGRQDTEVTVAREDGGEMKMGLSLDVPAATEHLKDAKPARKEAAKRAVDYMERSGAQRVLSKLVQTMMVEQPEDPLAFIMSFVAAEQASPKSGAGLLAGGQAMQMPDLSGHFSLLAEALRQDPSLYGALSAKTTALGVTFEQVAKPGLENRGHRMIKTAGVVAGDAESYTVFEPLFDAILRLRAGPSQTAVEKQPLCCDLDQIDTMRIDPDGKNVLSVQIRMSRNLQAIRFPPACSFEERREVEKVLAGAFLDLSGASAGQYFPLAGSPSFPEHPAGMSLSQESVLEAKKVLFYEPDSSIAISSGIHRDWPDARGIFSSEDGALWAWLNEEDHLRLFAGEEGDGLARTFGRICKVEAALKELLQKKGHSFACSDRFGYLSSGPANLGTGLCATVFVKLPMLSSQPDFRANCRRLQLQAHQSDIGIWALSSCERLGSSEVDQVNTVIAGCHALIVMEKKLERAAEEGFSEPSSPSSGLTLAATQPPLPEWSEVPGLGGEDYPGFPADECPEQIPDFSRHHSLMAEVLRKDPSIYDALRSVKTSNGVSFAQVIKPGADKPGHPMIKSVGAVAGDEETYTTFERFFEPLLFLNHNGFTSEMSHRTDFKLPSTEPRPDDELLSKYMTGVRIEASRNIRGLRLVTACDFSERRKAEGALADALSSLGGRFKGEYLPLMGSTSFPSKPQGMSREEATNLERAGIVFDCPTSGSVLASGVGRHWPDARGVFSTEYSELTAFVNDQDHLRFVLVDDAGEHQGLHGTFASFCEVHRRLEEALKEKGFEFMHSDRLGFITTCPSMLGSGMQVHVAAKLPLLSKRPDFKTICRYLRLEARKSDQDTEGEGVEEWKLTHRAILGMPEVAYIRILDRGIRQLARMEDALSRGEEVKLPGHGAEPLPGFPTEICPAELPDVSGHRTLVARVLMQDPSIYAALHETSTPAGVSFARTVKATMDSPCCGWVMPAVAVTQTGLVAGDADCYSTFAPLFLPTLEAFHGRLPPSEGHPSCLDADSVEARAIDPNAASSPCAGACGAVISVRARLARNVAGLRLPSACSAEERRETEEVLRACLEELKEDVSGEYLSLEAADEEPEKAKRLRACGVPFFEPKTTSKLAMGLARDWPASRGVFVGEDPSMVALINEEEHLSLVASLNEDNVKEAFARLCTWEAKLREALEQRGRSFARTEELGFVTGMPERLGTGLTISVRLKLPKAASNGNSIASLCDKFGLQLVAKAPGNIVEVANRSTLGVSEAELVNATIDACAQLVASEQA